MVTRNQNPEEFKDRKGNVVIKPKEKSVNLRQSVYGLYFKNGKVLMVKPNWSDQWDLPGGKIEANESFETALIREFREETGLEILDFESKPILQAKQNFYSDDTDEYFYSEMSLYLITKAEENNINKVDKEEIKEIKFIDPAFLNIENCKDFNIETVKLALKL